MQKAQAELAETLVEGVASSCLVKISMTCNNVIKRVTIDDAAMDDRETLEDLLLIALNDARAKAEATSNARMSGLMPAGFKLPF